MKIKYVISTLFFSTFLSCTTQNSTLSTASSSSQDPSGLFIVDCLLPGQVRKLGQLATYITARRAIKTPAVECEIRGGEYVAYDRANYLTALNIWMPKAQAGDPKAQNYVGEIHEKGMGLEPDYEIAHLWYKKAALQGNSKAQINLGYLYEKGLGVKQNKQIALEWYGKSSKLSQLKIPYATTISTKPDSNTLSDELKLLKASLKNSQTETKHLKNKLSDVRQHLSSSKSQLTVLQTDLAQVKNKIQAKKSNAQSNQQEVLLLKQIVNEKTQEINHQKTNIENLEEKYIKEIDTLKNTFSSTQKRAEQIISELKKENSYSVDSQVDLLVAEAKLAETERHLLKVNATSQQQLKKIEHEKELLISQVEGDKALKETYIQNISKKTKELNLLRKKLMTEKQQYESKIKQLQKNVAYAQINDHPKIEIIDPPFVLTRGVPTVTLRSMIKEREIIGKVKASSGLLSLSINDKKTKPNNQGLFKVNIKLINNETPVKIIAIDNKGAKSSLDFMLSLSNIIQQSKNTQETIISNPANDWKQLNFGNYHALVIANNDYQKVPKLDTPITDGRAVERVLRTRYGFKTKLLLNATRYQILSALNKLRSELIEDDNLLIYYAGHGELDKVNMRGHWLPIDADGDNTANWISTVAITDILNAMAAKHILVVSDSCYSGSMTRSSLARLDAGVSSKQRNKWLEAMLKTRSRTVLTSGGLKPVMDGGGGEHSIFANAFIQALENNNSLLEGQTLYRNVSNNIVAIAANYGIEQVPEYAPIRHAGHESGEFFFVPN